MKGRAFLTYGGVAVLAVVADQAVKRWAETALPFHEPVDVLPFLALFRTHNTGMAFSMLSWVSGTGLSLIVLAVVAFILYLALRTRPNQHAARLGFALIIGGAVGNLIDRVMLGYVIDYVLFHTPVWSFAIFNLADAMITVGAGLVLLDEVLAWRRERAGRTG